jgi:putative endonuclease
LETSKTPYFVYILQNPKGRFYIGQTEDLLRRIEQHNNPQHNLAKYTSKHTGPWQLVHHEKFETRSEAMKRERFIKSRRSAAWIKKHLLKGRASPDVHRD